MAGLFDSHTVRALARGAADRGRGAATRPAARPRARWVPLTPKAKGDDRPATRAEVMAEVQRALDDELRRQLDMPAAERARLIRRAVARIDAKHVPPVRQLDVKPVARRDTAAVAKRDRPDRLADFEKHDHAARGIRRIVTKPKSGLNR